MISLRQTFLGATTLLAVASARADVVSDWNALAANLPIAAPPVMARVMATMHGAMFDAVNSIERRYETYRFSVMTSSGASKDAAAAAAAHAVLVALVPAQKGAFDAALGATLARIPDGSSKTEGVGVGSAIAERMLAWRAADGFDAKRGDNPGTAPGVWRRTPPGMAPGAFPQFGGVTPFVLKTADQFPSPTRVALGSAEYARDLDEVRILGGRHSKQRSGEQTAVAVYWAPNEVPMWNAAARAASQARKLPMEENARLYALMHSAGADAIIVGFKIKYAANDWRPVTAIRHGGNEAWESLLITPAHPEYPSGHCIYSGAAAQVLRDFFGSDALKLDYVSPAGLGMVRSFSSFTQMAKEVEDARVWAGIHLRSTSEQSTELGRRIGAYAVASHMRPLN